MIRLDKHFRLNPDESAIGDHRIEATVAVRDTQMTVIDVIVEIVITDRNHWQRLLLGPVIEHLRLLQPKCILCTSAFEVVDHKQKLSTGL